MAYSYHLHGEQAAVKTREMRELLSDGTWHKSKDIENELQISGSQVRDISNQTGDYASGNKGYKRADLCTQEELRHSANDLKSRARKIVEHYKRLAKWIDGDLGQLTLDF